MIDTYSSAETQMLTWDTDVLGYKVAKILPACLDIKALQQALKELKSKDVRLVFWAADSTDSLSQQAALVENGFLADRKTTFLIDLSVLPSLASVPEVECYSEDVPTVELEALALQSGLYSRFRTDPRITEQQFEKVYKLWMLNSTRKLIADKILVIKIQQKIVGMATLGEKNGRGDIGLLAVAEDCRGKGYGAKLVQAAQYVFKQKGYQWSQVVTQGDNDPACRLYQHCGYEIEKVENFYHFWL